MAFVINSYLPAALLCVFKLGSDPGLHRSMAQWTPRLTRVRTKFGSAAYA